MTSPATSKRGPGRPREGARIEVRIPDELLAQIDRDRAAVVSRAEKIRQIIARHYHHSNTPPPRPNKEVTQ